LVGIFDLFSSSEPSSLTTIWGQKKLATLLPF